jgi:hypothetical protein
MSTRRRGAAARADGDNRPAAAAKDVQAHSVGGVPPAREDPTSLEIMFDVMRWTHAEARRQIAQAAAGVVDKAANDAAKSIASLWALALSAAKDAAPYLHPRLASVAPREEGEMSHEDWVAWCEEEQRKATNQAAGEAGHGH